MNKQWVKIKKITKNNKQGLTFDIWNKSDDCFNNEGNFLIEGSVVHNSIPEAVRNRDDKRELWKERLRKIHPVLLEVLEDTYGVICYHEDTLISMADGSHKPIRDIKYGDLVHSVDLTGSPRVRYNKVCGCAPTKISDGLRVILNNGYDVIVTPDHKIYCWDGYKRANQLSINDLVAIPNKLPSHSSSTDFDALTNWLGDLESSAYLVGLLLGDGCTSSTSISICAGPLEAAQCLEEWIRTNVNLTTRIYHHCRSYYIAIYNSDKTDKVVDLEPFEDTKEWWSVAYSKYSGEDIANHLYRSTWYAYNKLRQHHIEITGGIKNAAKTKWHDLLSKLALDCNLYHKRIPPSLMRASREHHGAVLAGLIDTDGHISTDQRGIDLVGFTSVSPLLLDDIRQILTIYGIPCSINGPRLCVWGVQKFIELVSPYLLLKSSDGAQYTGGSVGWVPKDAFINFVDSNYVSRRCFARGTGLSRRVFGYPCDFVRTSTATKAGMDLGDLRYHKVVAIEPIKSQQFYDMSVETDHNLVANGILASNCWQEQLASLWQRLGGFTAPEAQDARKAVAKKWAHKLKPIESKWVEGATRTIGRDIAIKYWGLMETFGRYAFNKSHGVSYCLVAHRCLWLKAHFAPEFWAAVMSDCHPKKLVRYMGVARSENWEPTEITYCGQYKPSKAVRGVKFDTINVENTTSKFTVTGDSVNQGLIGIKGLGENAATVWNGKRTFTGLDDLIDQQGKDKKVLERFIKLGAFKQFPGYENARATWEYYRYKYCSGKDITALKADIKQCLLDEAGWSPEEVEKERKRQAEAYFQIYHNRKKLPAKITNWKPVPDDSYEKVAALFPEDFTLQEMLEFEKQYLGYYLHSPLDLYKIEGNCTIVDAKRLALETKEDVKLEGVITDFQLADSKKGTPYGRMILSDGIQNTLVLIFGRQLAMQNADNFEPGLGVTFYAEYDEMRNTFSLSRGEVIMRLSALERENG